ncbi:hypothetical protein L596_027130 [Steinernema carpocapsae]|uniref:C-type lectin domain-containing protein n=1 Tax=Steinernema carpocapsae TaxID=34508 RepID=A0A4U5M3J7_STECR|nr:hypothetical protein L596_027130 [Steinernema carpocapsae]
MIKQRHDQTRPPVIVLASSVSVKCPETTSSSDVCRVAANLRSDNYTVITVGLSFHDLKYPDLGDLAYSECYKLTNNLDFAKKFGHQIGNLNCFCPQGDFQYYLDSCTRSSTCVRIIESPTTPEEGWKYCKQLDGSLVTITSSVKNKFLRDLGNQLIDDQLLVTGLTWRGAKNSWAWATGRKFDSEQFDGFQNEEQPDDVALNWSAAIEPNGNWIPVPFDNDDNIYLYACERLVEKSQYGFDHF